MSTSTDTSPTSTRTGILGRLAGWSQSHHWLAIGLGHSFMINRLRLPPFIATLATMAGLRSLATVVSQNRTINVPFESYRALGSNPWMTLPIFTGVALIVGVGLVRLLRREADPR